LVKTLAGTAPCDDQEAPVITIDYREPTPSETWSDQVKNLYDQGKLIKAIAAELGITRNLAAKALDCWHDQRGLPRPDGRSRRSTLDEKHLVPPRYIQLSEQAMRLYEAGHSREQIAERLKCCRPTITKALNHWRQLHGGSTPDGRRGKKRDGDSPQPEHVSDIQCNIPPTVA
jgi:transposase